jgi:hypothetical protein
LAVPAMRSTIREPAFEGDPCGSDAASGAGTWGAVASGVFARGDCTGSAGSATRYRSLSSHLAPPPRRMGRRTNLASNEVLRERRGNGMHHAVVVHHHRPFPSPLPQRVVSERPRIINVAAVLLIHDVETSRSSDEWSNSATVGSALLSRRNREQGSHPSCATLLELTVDCGEPKPSQKCPASPKHCRRFSSTLPLVHVDLITRHG